MRKAVVMGLLVAFSMLVLAGCASGPPEPIEVTVTLTDFGYEASLTTFEVGQPYIFVVTNDGALNHEFMISEPMMMMDGEMDMSEEEHDEAALFEIHEDDLPPGATEEIEFTFEEHHAEEELEFACHVEGHYEAGMHMPITVNP